MSKTEMPKERHHTTNWWHEGELWVEETRRYVKAMVLQYPEGCWTVMRPGHPPKTFTDAEEAKNFAEDES